MNLTTGEAQIVPDAAGATSGAAAADSAAGSPASSGGRPRLLLYPNQLKDKEPKRDGKEAGHPQPNSAGAPSTRTSGWVTERAPATDGD
jgi:hypothetical protein